MIRTVIACLSILLFLAAGMPGRAAETKKTVTSKLTTITAAKPNGSADPSQNAACKTAFQADLGQTVTTTYQIDVKTGMSSAQSKFLGTTYDLSPLGLSGNYTFGKYLSNSTPPKYPALYGVIFSISKDFKDPSSTAILELSAQTSCVLSSATKAMSSVESLRFGSGR